MRSIPNEELWAARCAARLNLVEYVREKNQQDRLLRGEQIEYVRSVERLLDPDALTLGFARRLATYKRLHLLAQDPERARRIMGGPFPVQLLVAGKAHPADGPGKDTLQRLYNLKRGENVFAERLIVVEDYDLSVAQQLVAGCDVWINLPRRPMEASGTSGMKSAINGGLQLSVLDGWWAEGYDGSNGWAIPGGAAQTWTVADSGSVLTLSGIVSGGLSNSTQAAPASNTSFTVKGSGAVDLTNTGNTFTGDILVDGGTLRVNDLAGWGGPTVASSTSKTITLTNGGTLTVTSGTLNPACHTTTNYKLVQIGTGGGTIDTASGATLQLDDAGQLFGSGALTKTGCGNPDPAQPDHGLHRNHGYHRRLVEAHRAPREVSARIRREPPFNPVLPWI